MSGIDPLTAAKLSKAAYTPFGSSADLPTILPPGWTADFKYSRASPSGNNQFITFVNADTKQAVITFKGTDTPLQHVYNLANDGYSSWASIKDPAEATLYQIRTDLPGYEIMTDGHSLGGGMAQALALEGGLNGYGQNSLPISTLAQIFDLAHPGDFNKLLAAYHAAGFQFDEVNAEGDVATAFYSTTRGLTYLDPNPTTVANPWNNLVTVGTTTKNPIIVGYGSIRAHSIDTVIDALSQQGPTSAAETVPDRNATAIADTPGVGNLPVDPPEPVTLPEADGTPVSVSIIHPDSQGDTYVVDEGSKSEVIPDYYPGGVARVDSYDGPEGTGTLESSLSDYPDGHSQVTTHDPSYGVSDWTQTYSGPNGTGALVSKLSDNADGTSQLTAYNPSGDVSTTTDRFSEPGGSGSLVGEAIDYSDDHSQEIVYSTDLPKVVATYSGPDGTGTLLSDLSSMPDGTSQLYRYAPSDGVSEDVQTFSGYDGTGSLVKEVTAYSAGGSQVVTYDPFDGVSKDVQSFSGAFGDGTKTGETVDLSDGTSQIYSFDPSAGVSHVEETYSGPDGGGDLVGKVTDYTTGSSQVTGYNASGDISESNEYYSGPDGTGNLYYQDTNYADGGSQSVLYTPSSGVDQTVEKSSSGGLESVTVDYGDGQSTVSTGYESGAPQTTIFSGPDGSGSPLGTTTPGNPAIGLGSAGGGEPGIDAGGATTSVEAGGTEFGGSLGALGAGAEIGLLGLATGDPTSADVASADATTASDGGAPGGVAELVRTYSHPAADGSVALVSELTNYADGRSEFIRYNPSGSTSKVVASYSGPDGSGMLVSVLSDYVDGRSAITVGEGASSSRTTVYNGPDGTGSLIGTVVGGTIGATGPDARETMAPTLGAGDDVQGSLAQSGDENFYRVPLTAGTTYWFNAQGRATGQGTASDPVLQLLGMNGMTLLASDQGSGVGGNSFMSYTPTATGAYYVTAGSASGGTGSYLLSERVADDYPSNPGTSGVLAPGASVAGTYDFVADTDWFRTEMTAGVTYRFDMTRTPTGPGTQIPPRLRLFGDGGATQLAYGDSGSTPTASITYKPTVTGTYFVSAEAWGSNIGTYRLSEETIAGVAPTSSPSPGSRMSFAGGSDAVPASSPAVPATAVEASPPSGYAASEASHDTAMGAIPLGQLFASAVPETQPQYAADYGTPPPMASLITILSDHAPYGVPHLLT